MNEYAWFGTRIHYETCLKNTICATVANVWNTQGKIVHVIRKDM